MIAISRRELIRRAAVQSAALAAVAAGAVESGANPLGLPIGSQVWPTRSMLGDFPAYVKMMAEIGVTRLELCSPIGYGREFSSLSDGKEVRRILADHGMRSESSHFTLRELRNSQQRSIDWAKEVGIKQMLVASLGDGNGGSTPTEDQIKAAADEYNKIAAVAAMSGMQQGLHNEGFEVSMLDGKRTYDLLLDLLDPKLVKFQFQMSTFTAGFIAADYFTKYPGRFFSMHLQDLDRSAAVPLTQAEEAGRRMGQYTQVALGRGLIDWPKTFKAARVGGVKNMFVEQNWDLTQQSVAYLKKLRV